MHRNVSLYRAYQVARHLLFWLPVFFLYFSSVLPVGRVLVLESVYYAAVVVLEVPSGYLSDRLGRRPTLIVAMLGWLAAGVLFAATSSFAAFVVAQLLLAAGMAFNSGTDGALLYDSLDQLGRAETYAEHEAKAQGLGLAAMGLAALVGGALAGVDLRLAYLAFAVAAAAAVVIAWMFVEPRVGRGRALAPVSQLGAVVARMRTPKLGWLLVFVVAMTVFNHVPYELVQPYLRLLLSDPASDYAITPLVAGAVTAATMLISAIASTRAVAMRSRWGVGATLLAMMVLQGAVIVSLLAPVHGVVVGVLLLRGIPGAVMRPVVDAAVHPDIDPGMRATYLSVHSFAGRLAFSLALLVAAAVIGAHRDLMADGLQRLAAGFGLALGVALIVLALTSSRLTRR